MSNDYEYRYSNEIFALDIYYIQSMWNSTPIYKHITVWSDGHENKNKTQD